MLEVQQVTVAYGGSPAVCDLSLEVDDGEFVAVIGANGAGKTTLIRAVAALEKLSSGTVTFDGHVISKLKPNALVALGIALVPEGRHLFPALSVRDNLILGWFAKRRSGLSREERLTYCLNLFPELVAYLDTTAGALSGGQQQMVAISRSLMSDPRLLILDEPSLGLAPLVCDRIFDVLVELRHEAKSVLLVEQNARRSLEVSDRTYVMERGRIVRSGRSEELLGDQSIHRYYLGGASDDDREGGADEARSVPSTSRPREDRSRREQ